jgi:biotin carboxyl carrier protein
MLLDIQIGSRKFRLDLQRSGGLWQCNLDDRQVEINAAQRGPDGLSLLVGNRSFEVRRAISDGNFTIHVNGVPYEVAVRDPRSFRNNQKSRAAAHGSQALTASMPGKVVRVLAREGDHIKAGQGIVIIEAMKMQNEIRSPRAGIVQKLAAREGANVNAGELLAVVE